MGDAITGELMVSRRLDDAERLAVQALLTRVATEAGFWPLSDQLAAELVEPIADDRRRPIFVRLSTHGSDDLAGYARLTRELNADDLIYKELTVRGVLSMPVEETFRAVDIIASGRYPFDRLHTKSFPIEQAEEAIHALAGQVPGVNPIHLALVPGAPRVRWSA